MQRRTHITNRGECGALEADAIRFWKSWTGPKVKLSDLDALIAAAIRPESVRMVTALPSEISPLWFTARYSSAPDFVCAFVAAMRRIWFKGSKRQRLRNWLACESTVFRKRNREAAILYDKEIAGRFNQQHPGDEATEGDVQQARSDLARRYRDGERMAERLRSSSILQKRRKV